MQLIKTQALALIPALVIFAAWLPSLVYQLGRSQPLGWIPQAQLTDVIRSVAAFLFGVDNHALGVPPIHSLTFSLSTLSIALLVIFILAFTATRVYAQLESKAQQLYLFTAWNAFMPIAFVMLVSQFGIHLYVERYLIPYGVLILLFIAQHIGAFKQRTTLALITCYMALLIFIQPTIHKTPFKSISTTLKSTYDTAPMIVSTDAMPFMMLRYYMGNHQEQQLRLYDYQNTHRIDTWPMMTTDRIIQTGADLPSGAIIVSTIPLDPTITDTRTLTTLQTIDDYTLYQVQ